MPSTKPLKAKVGSLAWEQEIEDKVIFEQEALWEAAEAAKKKFGKPSPDSQEAGTSRLLHRPPMPET
jgi:hypothetical protein